MADKNKAYAFNEDAYRRVREAIRRVEGSAQSGSRQRRQPPAGVSAGCERQNTIWDITVFGSPTAGDFDIDAEINGVADTINIDYNDSASDVAVAFDSDHSEVASTDINVTGGPLPDATIRIEFIGNYANTLIPLPTVSFGSLTGGTGRGVIVAMAQRGH